jgi:Uma2 family endonuclease
MSTQSKSFLTPEQYLETERKAGYKSEYLKGEVFAMSGASIAHNTLTVNLTILLHPQVRKHGCRLFATDMRVRVPLVGLYTYPDIVVVCDKPQFIDSSVDTLLNPTFLAEVLSPSTEAYDRGRKFEYYQTLESLSQYLLIAQDRMRADLITRHPDGDWRLKSISKPEQVLEISSIGGKLTLADIYEDVVLPPPQLTGELRP